MKVLRLGNSNDFAGGLRKDERASGIAERMLAEASGEPVETNVRTIWPTPDLPDLLERWLDRYEPDLVFLSYSSYWFAYQSVPLKIERTFPFIGRHLRSASNQATARPWLARSRPYHLVRQFSLRTIGGATYFTTTEVIERMEACIRRVLAREHVALVVRGTFGGQERYRDLPARLQALHHERRLEVHHALKALCSDLHVVYVSREVRQNEAEVEAILGADAFHWNAQGHQIRGEVEGAAMVQAWQALAATV
ncbi:MAG: hypothetical protein ACR2HN_02140 [Tepidiformaceae bacterium]